MPIIPDIGVSERALPAPQKPRSSVPDPLLGLAGLADRGAQVAQFAAKAFQEAEKTRLMELENGYLEELDRLMNDPESGYLNTKGTPALEMAGPVSERMGELVSEYAGKAPDRVRQEFEQRLFSLGRGYRNAVRKHAFKQKVAVQYAQAAAAMDLSASAAVNMLDNLGDTEGVQAWLQYESRYEEAAREAAALRVGRTVDELGNLPGDHPDRKEFDALLRQEMAKFHIGQAEALIRLGDAEAVRQYLAPTSKTDAAKWLNEDERRQILAKLDGLEKRNNVMDVFRGLLEDSDVVERVGELSRFNADVAKRKILEMGVDDETYNRLVSMIDNYDASQRRELRDTQARVVDSIMGKIVRRGGGPMMDPRNLPEWDELVALDRVAGTTRASELLRSYNSSIASFRKAAEKENANTRRALVLASLGSLKNPPDEDVRTLVSALEAGDVNRAWDILSARGALPEDREFLLTRLRNEVNALQDTVGRALFHSMLSPVYDGLFGGNKRLRDAFRAYLDTVFSGTNKADRDDVAKFIRRTFDEAKESGEDPKATVRKLLEVDPMAREILKDRGIIASVLRWIGAKGEPKVPSIDMGPGEIGQMLADLQRAGIDPAVVDEIGTEDLVKLWRRLRGNKEAFRIAVERRLGGVR